MCFHEDQTLHKKYCTEAACTGGRDRGKYCDGNRQFTESYTVPTKFEKQVGLLFVTPTLAGEGLAPGFVDLSERVLVQLKSLAMCLRLLQTPNEEARRQAPRFMDKQ